MHSYVLPPPPRKRWVAALTLALVLALAGSLAGYASWQQPAAVEAQSVVDYDADDGLIEVNSLARLNAIRWDLNGDGAADDTANASNYTTAFPDAATGMGCPLADHDNDANTDEQPAASATS